MANRARRAGRQTVLGQQREPGDGAVGQASAWTAWDDAWPRRAYVICATARSGSTYLCDLLRGSGAAGRPLEYFEPRQRAWRQRQWGARDFATYLDLALGMATTPNGVCGVKILWPDLQPLLAEVRAHWHIPAASDLDALRAAFPALRFLYLSRHDKLRQGISLYRARVTDGWVAGMGSQNRITPAFIAEEIMAAVEEVTADDRAWQKFFRAQRLEPLSIVYEDLAASPEETVMHILEYLDLSLPPDAVIKARRVSRQADARTEDWVARLKDLHGTRRAETG